MPSTSVKFKNVSRAGVASLPIEDGTIIITKTGGDMYVDVLNERVHISDIHTLTTGLPPTTASLHVGQLAYGLMVADGKYHLYINNGGSSIVDLLLERSFSSVGLNTVLQAGSTGNKSLIIDVDGGEEWTKYLSSDTNGIWVDMCYGGGMYLAVSQDGVLIRSQNGTTWSGAYPYADTPSSICYGNGIYLISLNTADTRIVMRSTDGLNWEMVYPEIEECSWGGMCFGNGKFVVVSSDASAPYVAYSTDGFYWTLINTAISSTWTSVCYGNGQYVAVADSGTYQVMTSPDGQNWTPQMAAGTAESWHSVCYGLGMYVAISDTKVMTSPDGIYWTIRPTTITSNLSSICYGEGTFVITVRNTSGEILTSGDGVNWSVVAVPTTSIGWSVSCYGDGKFVAVADSNIIDVDVIVSSAGALLEMDTTYGYLDAKHPVLSANPERPIYDADAQTMREAMDANGYYSFVTSITPTWHKTGFAYDQDILTPIRLTEDMNPVISLHGTYDETSPVMEAWGSIGQIKVIDSETGSVLRPCCYAKPPSVSIPIRVSVFSVRSLV